MKGFRGLILFGAIGLAGSLVGCTSAPSIGVADERTGGFPEGVDMPPFTEGPVVVAYDDGGVDVVTWGSSSCPAEATSAAKEDGEIVVVFTSPSDGPCTADMAPTTHSFSAESIGSSVPETARLIFTDFDDEQMLDVIRADERKGTSF